MTRSTYRHSVVSQRQAETKLQRNLLPCYMNPHSRRKLLESIHTQCAPALEAMRKADEILSKVGRDYPSNGQRGGAYKTTGETADAYAIGTSEAPALYASREATEANGNIETLDKGTDYASPVQPFEPARIQH